MIRYIGSRIGQSILTVLLLLVFTFAAVRFTGDPADRLLPEDATPEDRALLRSELHLDETLPAQFSYYLRDIASGNFGTSYKWRVSVREVIAERLPVTLTLGALAASLTMLLGVPLGVIAATRRGKWQDSFILVVALIGQSVPIFVTALAGMLLFAVNWRMLPVAGVDNPLGYVLPTVTLSWFGLAALIRVTRISMLNVLGSEYILTARAKGLRRGAIVYRHALRNALIPIVTIFGLILANLLTGTIVTETMFGLPGIGRLAVESIVGRDFPVVQGFVIFATLVFVTINLLVDLIYGLIDPRVRVSTR